MSTEAAETKNEALCCEGKLGELWAAAEKCAQREPMKCSGVAFLSGFLLAVLPVGWIVAALVRIAFSIARPLLVVLGAMKALEEIEKRRLP